MDHDDDHDDWRIALYYCYVPLSIIEDEDNKHKYARNDKNSLQQLTGVDRHVQFQQRICQERELKGRIRVSSEGINGVLSGRLVALQEYEQMLREELQSILQVLQMQHQQSCNNINNDNNNDNNNNNNNNNQLQQQEGEAIQHLQEEHQPLMILDLDVKYCHLHTHLPVSSQLFDSLSVKITREVVSLFEPGKTNGQQPSSPVTSDHRNVVDLDPNHRNYYWIRRRRRRKGNQKKQTQQTQEDSKSNDSNSNNQLKQQEMQVEENLLPPIHPQTDETLSSNSEKQHHLPSPAKSINPSKSSILLPPPSWMDKYQPAPHLSPRQWHELLQQHASTIDDDDDDDDLDNDCDAVLLDARNVYESRVGYFAAPNIPTILANTRKFSDLPQVMQQVASQLSNKHVFMYCTGGVRCERASMYLQALFDDSTTTTNNVKSGGGDGDDDMQQNNTTSLWNSDLPPPKRIFQLQGGIQRYLEEFGEWEQEQRQPNTTTTENSTESKHHPEDTCYHDDETKNAMPSSSSTSSKSLFRGKNFVFDPRRTDPRISMDIVGRCLLCGVPHDDYDNGAASCDEQEARCQKCRVLLLVCPNCRPTVQWKPTSCATTAAMSVTDRGDDMLPHADSNINVNNKQQHDSSTNVLPPLLCGKDKCVDEGNSVSQIATILLHNDDEEI